MTLTRTSYLTSGFLVICFFLLLFCGLSLTAAARPHGALAPKAATATLSYATVLRGRASWYGREHQGMRTSNGERFNRFKYTCAHKSLPFGTRLRVTNLKTGKSVVVRVSDRGPFRHQRILDLAEVAARPLGIVTQGAATVIAQVVPATTPLGPSHSPRNLLALKEADPNPTAAFTTYQLTSAADSATFVAAQVLVVANNETVSSTQPAATLAPTPRFAVQAGSFADEPSAQALRAQLLALDPALAIELTQEMTDGQPRNRVLIGQLDTWLAAETVRRRLQMWGVASLVRQVPVQPAVAVSTTALVTTLP
jgi:rare lipoprotein A